MSVLDVGCGTGSISAGIAAAVGPAGFAVGLDRDAGLLEIAERTHGGIPNLRFELGDATALSFVARFDCVTAARVMQWIGDPALAILQMKRAAKPGGILVVLDYNHAANAWEPEPPRAFQRFYRAFLDWRETNHWDNRMADRLPGLLHSAGLTDIESSMEDEIITRTDPGFSERAALWLEVIENLGDRVAAEGFCTPGELQAAQSAYRPYLAAELATQTLSMRTVKGRVPGAPHG
jgi:SAM-dependent methyltransferase